jgi:uncharacterized Tic20 family protein
VLLVLDLVFLIVGAIRANDGKPHRYPLAIPFVS